MRFGGHLIVVDAAFGAIHPGRQALRTVRRLVANADY
jgi:hypothetical protein